ncbi:nitrile hydratase accessory protein [Acidisoma silvae]|uniref:Nitrile hydratase accessory protein n=1 Tax=Acidisoma silvae TaxID=2802396 RepID=A0A963YTX8_9PROT|nr:nitrile hydratase accessory protein [Acidisoma silvae]MCB8877027.1 nitrile hydratase accessory protein [Acidisoma silvae]
MVPDFKTTVGLPQDQEGPIFAAPWEAAAFAMAVKLCEDGHFTWPEWVSCYSAEIREHEAEAHPGQTIHYYEIWQEALESMLAQKGLLDLHQLDHRHEHLREHPPHHDHAAKREPVAIA